jgi:predicted MFS family arabinose efflux permease
VPTLALAAFVNTMGSLALGPFLPFVADELETSVALVGQVTALTMLLAALLGLVIGPLADHYGFRRTLIGGLLAVAVSGLGTGLAPGFLLLLLAALIGSLGRAAVMPTAHAVAGTGFPDETVRRRAISWISTGHTCAPLLGIPLLTTIAAVTDWRAAFFVAGGLALAMVPVVWRTLAADEAGLGASPRLASALAAYAPLWRHPRSLALIGQLCVGSIGTWATFTYLGAYLMQQHGFTPPQVGVGYLAVGIGTMLPALAIWVVRRRGRRAVIRSPVPTVLPGQATGGGLDCPALGCRGRAPCSERGRRPNASCTGSDTLWIRRGFALPQGRRPTRSARLRCRSR